MSYSVQWLPEADDQLAAVWIDCYDRTAVAEAAEWFDREFRRAPDGLGDAVFDTVRVAAYGPLGVEFEVIPDDRRVVVLSAWDVYRGRPDPTGH